MTKLINSLFNICYIEELARRDVWINRINPLVKLIVTLIYILSVTSIDKYSLSRVILYGVYPVFILTAVDLPIKPLLQKMIVPILMGASLGILNPFLDDQMIMAGSGMMISAGWLSFASLFLKSGLCILAALILISTTTVEALAAVLETLRFPKILVVQFLLMFRYITILVSEFERSLTAYSMRASGETSLRFETWGSFIGQIFMRTSERAVRLYESMKLRGFDGHFTFARSQKVRLIDGLYLTFWMAVFGSLLVIRTYI